MNNVVNIRSNTYQIQESYDNMPPTIESIVEDKREVGNELVGMDERILKVGEGFDKHHIVVIIAMGFVTITWGFSMRF